MTSTAAEDDAESDSGAVVPCADAAVGLELTAASLVGLVDDRRVGVFVPGVFGLADAPGVDLLPGDFFASVVAPLVFALDTVLADGSAAGVESAALAPADLAPAAAFFDAA
ncbi:hypothetical protein AAFP32_16375 [Brevibacterium sp. CBA3109]|uniref:Uncharacterized protein n=1 Tax=Brevibacterium koreense TaxID=3140787 RepID=A0AAU7UL22_9MICO